MPEVKRPEVLAAFYEAAGKLIARGAVPSTIIHANHMIFRSVDVKYLPRPPAGSHVSRYLANEALVPRDGSSDANNRFSGPSCNGGSIPAAGGLYCVLQQQALVNEVMHYTQKPGRTAFASKCVLKIRLMAPANCVDLSPHNPGHFEFLSRLFDQPGVKQSLAKPGLVPSPGSIWDEITHDTDCSAARGIGLAVAHSMYHGLVAETVRKSERSARESGDNLILYGSGTMPVANLSVEEALYFNQAMYEVESFPVAFP